MTGSLVIDFSCALCGSAMLMGGTYLLRARPRRGWFYPLAAAWVLLTAWLVALAFSVRAPFADLRTRHALALLCLALGPWLAVSLSIGAPSVRAALRRWLALVVVAGGCTLGSSLWIWVSGVDWITGIGVVPTTILTRSGVIALGIALAPALIAAVIMGRRLAQDVSTMPAVALANIGAMASTMAVATRGLWHGYVTTQDFSTTAPLAGASALLWTIGVLHQLPVARSFALSRGVVYAAVATSVVVSYAVAARLIFLIAAPAAAALPEILPAVLFLTGAGLLAVLGSRRMRYRLRSAIGRHFFRSKHDYGAVWVMLTRLVTEARDRADLAQRVATFCRDLLCVDRATVYLYDSAGTVRPAAVAGPLRHSTLPSAAANGDFGAAVSVAAGAPTVFAGDRVQPIVADLLCPMRVNGHLLGYIAIDSAPGAPLDDEDHLVMDYVTAQVASALELHRLGDEIGDAREVGSFHRLSAFIIHDLKNLAAQQSFVLENAQKFSGDPAFVRDALAAFSDSTDRMRALIARLRPGAAPDGGTPGVTCDVMALARELTAGARVPEHCHVRLAFPPHATACLVRVDAAALTQVLTNLLVNAVESLPPNRGEIQVRIVRDLADWCIEVRDNGCGISDAYMRNDLFRPFRSTKDAGLGIGLYQCKVVIEAAGGRIHVTSQPNVGTTVQIILPAAHDSAPPLTTVHEDLVHGQAVAARR